MRNRIERLRLWLLAGAGLLVIVLAMFVGSARYLSHHFRLGKLASLASNIKGSSNDVTFSRSSKDGTEYSIHAASKVDYRDGKIALHEVTMTLYGQKHDRADRIYGQDFEYDQSAGVVRAIGLVHIDLQAAEAAGAGKPHGSAVSYRKVMHATTSGLIYLEKLGVAATSEKIDFQLGEMTGHAVGADYNTDTGLLMLHNAVGVNGIERGRPMSLQASSAELDDRNQRIVLAHARFVSEEKTAYADEATLHTRADGSLERIEAQGNVTAEGGGAKMLSARAQVVLNSQNKPRSAVLLGGVGYSKDESMRRVQGHAESSTIAFDEHGQPEHAVFAGTVHLTERTRVAEAGAEPWNTSDLTAKKVEVTLTALDGGPVKMRDAQATGAAHLTILTITRATAAKLPGERRTEVLADDLKAHFVNSAGKKQPPQIETLAGRGHTLLHSVSADAVEQTSSGDALDARFRTASSTSVTSIGGESERTETMDRLLSAIQQGHVAVMRRMPANTAVRSGKAAMLPEDVQHATAAQVTYDGDSDRLMLTGGVQVIDALGVLWADTVRLDRKTGDAVAEGTVKVNYVQDNSGASLMPQAAGVDKGSLESMHIIANQAEIKHATQVAIFHGKPVRLWQGGSQVQAPVIEVARAQSRLTAHGSSIGADAQVHTVLVTTGSGAPTKMNKSKLAASAAGSGVRPAQAVRVASNELIYSQAAHAAVFTGKVRVESVDGVMLAQEAVAYLQKAGTLQAAATESESAGATAGLELNGPIDRIVATGHIEIGQPDRHAKGEHLVYTAIDRSFLLSGDASSPAEIVDAQGTSTAAAFRFHALDHNAEAVGALPGETSSAQRIHAASPLGNDVKFKPKP